MRRCEECGADIAHRRRGTRFCSKRCQSRMYMTTYQHTPQFLAWRAEYAQRPEVRAKNLEYLREWRARKKAEQQAAAETAEKWEGAEPS